MLIEMWSPVFKKHGDIWEPNLLPPWVKRDYGDGFS
ncbi:Uncharacterised protein [Streptococcus pyogenes]|nr:Uncharacterised protein [Streptococcus pyogenes]